MTAPNAEVNSGRQTEHTPVHGAFAATRRRRGQTLLAPDVDARHVYRTTAETGRAGSIMPAWKPKWTDLYAHVFGTTTTASPEKPAATSSPGQRREWPDSAPPSVSRREAWEMLPEEVQGHWKQLSAAFGKLDVPWIHTPDKRVRVRK